MNKELFPDFSGKTTSMVLIDESRSHDLDNPRFEYQGGRLFIIGIVPEIATESGKNGGRWGLWLGIVFVITPCFPIYISILNLFENQRFSLLLAN